MDVAQFGRDQWPGPASETGWWRILQHRQNAPAGLGVVLRGTATPPSFGQTGKAFAGEPPAPQAHRPRHCADRSGDRPRRPSFRRHQDDRSAQHVALFTRRCPHSRFKHRTILRRQPDLRSFGNHPNVES